MNTNDPFATPSPDRESRHSDAGPAPAPEGGYAAPGPTSPAPGLAAPQGGYAPPQYGAPGFQNSAPGFQNPAPHAAPLAYGPPNTGQSQPGQPHPGQPGSTVSTDGVSIAALVTGLVGLGPVAVVLGAIGLRRTAAGQRKGTGMAVTGLIAGILGTIVATALVTWSIAAASSIFDSDAWTGGSLVGDSDATYGDDAFLDALWDECAAGDDLACDDLFAESPLGSEYEDFGYTCGERGRSILQWSCASGDSE